MGQGYETATVLQLANYVATIANGGNHMQAHVVQEITDANGRLIYQAEPTVLNTVEDGDNGIAAVREAMLAVTSPGGTAYSLFSSFPSNIRVAAKTGTAQTGLAGDDKNRDYHGIFVAFAPYDDPQVAYAGVIEYGYHGNSSAGYVCRDVLREYFGLWDASKVGFAVLTPVGENNYTMEAVTAALTAEEEAERAAEEDALNAEEDGLVNTEAGPEQEAEE